METRETTLAHAVLAQVGALHPDVKSIVHEEIAAALAGSAAPRHPTLAGERVIISANGRNRVGIVAQLTGIITAHQGDIRDISQTIVGDHFTMIIMVNLAAAVQGRRFVDLKADLEQAGHQLGLHVVALHDDLFNAMHSV